MKGTSQPTLRQLQYFQALADAGHYRKAAESVGVSQPSLSLQISNLEAALGARLVERGRAGAVLTPAGREVLHRVGAILEEVSALPTIAEQTQAGISGTYRLGASAALGPYLLPHVVRHLHAKHPKLRLFIRDGVPRALLEDLLSGRLDLVLSQLPVLSADVQVTRLFREPLYLAVSNDHSLARRDYANESDLAGETLLALSSGFSLHAQLVELAREAGASLRQDYEGSSLDALRQMVAMNMGITLLPALYARSEVVRPGGDVTPLPFRGDVTLLPFRGGRVTRSIGMIWRRTSSSSAAFAAFSEVIRAVVRSDFAGVVHSEG